MSKRLIGIVCCAFLLGCLVEMLIHNAVHKIQFEKWEKSQKELNIIKVNGEKLYCIREVYGIE